jgi:hypothetical protein
VGNLALKLDPTPLERNVFRPSFSPIPTGVGRKTATVTFEHEIKGSGLVTTRSKLGYLLRGCAFREIFVSAGAANQIETPIPFGTVVNGPTVTWGKTAAPTSLYGSYLVDCVLGGASATAKLQVKRWGAGELDATVMPNLRNEARVNFSSATTLALGGTPVAPTFTVGGTPAAGDTLYATIGGLTFEYDVVGSPSAATVATALAALIDADSRLTAAAVGAVITIGFTSGAAITTVTSGSTAIALGASGATITPTWTGNLVIGQQWIVELYEVGYMYMPTSKSSLTETVTLYVFKDGQLHRLTACTGTVTFSGDAGKVGKATFEFKGTWNDPQEQPTPLNAVFEQTIPPQIELAEMSIKGDLDFCAQSFTITLANKVELKECMNAIDGYDGSQITGRTPTAQLNPEATYEAFTGMWGDFSNSVQFPMHLRVGQTTGNLVRFYADRCNFTGLTYGDRANAVTLDVNLQLNGVSSAGDDELRVVFP